MATADQLSLVRTARLFALLTASIHDSLQTAHTSKFVYRLWRPETAVAAADIDDNADTLPETGWTPLLVSPPYPSHASNMSCIGAGAAQMLANVFGTDARSFTATWYTGDSPPAVVHAEPYDSFWALGQDEGSSRVLGGIHYRFEITASEQSVRRSRTTFSTITCCPGSITDPAVRHRRIRGGPCASADALPSTSPSPERTRQVGKLQLSLFAV